VAGSATASRSSVLNGQRPVTTTDAWKLFAIVFVLVDHWGLYFDSDEMWWRLFGRLASPVFFFFIGFARTRTVPWTWIFFGLLITAVDYATADNRQVLVNILLNFALLRLALPSIEAHVMPYPARLAAVALASAALIPVLDPVLEYGGEGWLWALFGLAHRMFLESGGDFARVRRDLLGVAAGLAYIVRERSDYGFDLVQSALLVVFVVGLVLGLMRFRRTDLPWQPPPPVKPVFTFTGRHTLEIYAVTLLAMQLTAYAIGSADAGEADGGDDDG
jgi:TraX protein